MFEKEAEEYIMRKDVITENDRVPFDNGYGFQTVSFEDEVKKAFKDGAEFGYNKMKEDADKMKSQFLELCNLKDMRIKELEKENAELKKHIENIYANHCGNCNRNRLNASLKKENAELREKCEKLEQGYVWHDYDVGEDTYEDTHEGRWVKRDEAQKLEKAEKIIKELLDTQVQLDLYRSVFKERILRAEEFLKDLEQPKMFASQVPAPEPPKMETVSEDYKPFSLLK